MWVSAADGTLGLAKEEARHYANPGWDIYPDETDFVF